MIYPNIRVPIPDMGGYTFSRGDVSYVYVYVGERKPNEAHPKSKCIGRIEKNVSGENELMPNTFYYDLMGLPQPELAVMEGCGRKPWHPKPRPLAERPVDSEIAMGYGLVISLLSAELNLISCLNEAFGEKNGRRILSLAAYLCERPHYSMSGLDEFIGKNLSGAEFDMKFGRREAGQLFVDITPEQQGAFYSLWNKAHPSGREIFYDVTSFSTYSGQIMSAHYGYNRDHEDLPQINQGLFCDRETARPLFMCSYDGALNDRTNFNSALKRAKEHGVGQTQGKKRISIVTDGGFSPKNTDWSHLLGYDVIIGVSCDYLKDVREAYIKWTEHLTEKDRENTWECGDSLYISSSVPFSFGGLEGELMMYRDLSLEVDKRAQFTRCQKVKLEELLSTPKAPKTGFDKWAESFKPYFKVTKSAGRKGFVFEKDAEATTRALALCGKVTLFVKRRYCKLSEQEVMNVYRSKGSVEDCFDTTKNGLSDKRLHVHGDKQVDGKLFVMFVALILRRAIHTRLDEYLKTKGMSDETAIRELENVKFCKSKEGWCLKDSITKIQRELFQHLNLRMRDDAELQEAMFKPRIRRGRKSKINPQNEGAIEQVLEDTI